VPYKPSTTQHKQTQTHFAHLGLGDGVDVVLELVVLAELGLADQVVELHEGHRHQVGL